MESWTQFECQLIINQGNLVFDDKKNKLAETVPAGDMLALQELCEFPVAFSQVDECGWYPLHRAVVQPLVPVLEMVLYGG